MQPNSKVNSESRRVSFLDLREITAQYQGELEEAALRTIRSGRYLNGPETAAFEEELAASCGAKYAVALSNGLDALRLMIRSQIDLGRLRPGDEVIYPANTYIASVLPLTEFGLKPVGIDPSEADFNLDLREAEKRLTTKTRAVMGVHLYGNPCWESEAARRLHDRGILLFEDNAQGIGALAAGEGLTGSRVTGGLGDCAAFSFYPTKNVGAMGDAGAVCTSDAELASRVRTLANYGSDRRYHNVTTGYNCRMDELQAAMLRVKLRHLEEVNERRRVVAALYDRLIQNPLITKPRIFDDRRQVWHQYVVRTPRRDSLQKFLADNAIATDIHYATPPHLQPCYAGKLGGPYPLTECMAEEVLSLPIACVSDEEVALIAETINNFNG